MRVGLIVNPIAGMGGLPGLKGTDGADTLARARALGAVPTAADRANRAIGRLESRRPGLTLVTAGGAMGADVARGRTFEVDVLPLPCISGGDTTADDTRVVARQLLERDVDLILFAGGDGTTRDIYEVVGDRVPVLGIPTGVKMHSGVFATTPERAGDVAACFAEPGRAAALRDGEVVDTDDEAARTGGISRRLYGVMRVPDDPWHVQPAKAAASPTSDEAELDAVCAGIAEHMDPRRIYVLGPGTTTRRIMRTLGLPKTLLGVDAVRGGRPVGLDLGESELLDLLGQEPATVLLGVIGGQGALLGRGNQQLSPRVLRRIGTENVEIVAGLRKLLALEPPVLRVDTGDPALDAELAGYRRVHVAPGRTLVSRIAA